MLVDTTDMPKQRVHSVGVARQDCGRLGQVANCQAGVFVAYAGEGGATLVHRRLFLTEAWAGDEAYAERRRRCGVPEEAASFRTKPQLALELLRELVAEGSLPARWVSCDEGYGRSVDFLDGVAALGLGYMAEVPVDTRLWPARPPTVVPRTRARRAPGAPPALEARALAAQLPADAWTRQRVTGDGRGPAYADFAIRRVVASRGNLPGPDVWLVLRRRSGADPVRVFLCHAPRRIRPARAGPSRPASGKAGSCWVWAITRAAAGRAGIVTRPCACSCTSSCCRASGRSKKAARPDAVPGGGGPGGRAGPVSQPAVGRTHPAGGGPGPPAGPRRPPCGRRPFPRTATPAGTATLTSRCSDSYC